MPIHTLYYPGGHTLRRPVGYQGKACYEAARPYEQGARDRREIRETTEGEVEQIEQAQRLEQR